MVPYRPLYGLSGYNQINEIEMAAFFGYIRYYSCICGVFDVKTGWAVLMQPKKSVVCAIKQILFRYCDKC